ncbi:RICIN domain-containing protein [uncultured Aquimarina sp.]|uniref:T9SS type A sorting domain-containing protein n=1 Tax=uncultured Aquimarina sp. TaxID=575652 RepID=UPI002628223D|nr:RICIN domain-containing protein [uncultured Aquimarina sp.]
MKKTVLFFLFSLIVSQVILAQRTISSLEEFIELQDASNQNIKMAPGTYHISSSTKTLFEGGNWIVRTRGSWPGLFDFTGNNNIFDLTGVTFTFDSTIINEMPNLAHGTLVRLGGTNNTWLGFNLQELPGNNDTYGVYIHVSGGVVLEITGSEHHFENLTLKARYSHPYGFGSLYGKTGSSTGMLPGSRLGKKSGVVLKKLTNSTFNNVLVDHSAFGHTLFFDGPINNVVIENATVIAESRSTNDLRANGIDGIDRNGVPFGLNYNGTVLTGTSDNNVFFDYFDTDNLDQCQSLDSGFQASPIRNNYQFSLTEDAFRGYNQDLIENLIIRNAYVIGARSGVALGIASKGLEIDGMTIKGTAGHGVPACNGAWNSSNGGEGDASALDIPSYAVVKNIQADAAYSTVLELAGARKEVTADMEILDPDNGYMRPQGSTALALISGSDHKLRLWKRDGQALDEDLVIKVGNQATSGLLLCNMTKQSITLSSNVTNSTIYSIGNVIDSSNGSNTVINVSSLNQEPCECASLGTNVTACNDSSFDPDPNKTYYIDVPIHNLRLAANGSSEEPYTTSTDTTGDDVEWKFIAKGNGSWHIQRAAGGSLPRLRTDNTEFADMQATANSGSFTYYNFTQGASSDTHFLTLPDGPAGRQRLQVNREGLVRFMSTSSDGSWESFTITEVNTTNIVHITKRNAPDFAIDGMGGGADGQNIYLWEANQNNVNQKWIEIDRGNGYYSYQKQGTNYCIDGNGGGADRQNVYLWTCGENNQNQQWQKVAVGGGAYKLIKRNASGYALDGGSNGTNGQNVQLYNSSSTSQNLHWIITSIDDTKAPELSADEAVMLYPNPVVNTITIERAADSVISIYDVNGKKVYSATIANNTETIDLSNLPTGLYYAKVLSQKDKTILKIIKK